MRPFSRWRRVRRLRLPHFRESLMPAILASQIDPLHNSSIDGWPSTVDMKVIVPGLVHYEDLRNSNGESVGGNVLVQKDAFDRMAASLEGKPIINWDHRKVSPEDFKKGRAQGVIVGPAIFNAVDGWYHAKGLVWDEATRKNIENGYSISCAYTVSEWGEGPGTHNQVPYMREVLNGSYTHIAVVPVPRYEGARIELLNSNGGKTMSFLSLFRKDKPEEKIEIDMATELTLENGSKVSLEALTNSYKAEEAKKLELQNKALEDDRIVEVNGKKVTIKELKNAHLAMYNEAEKRDLEEKHNSGSHKTRLTNCVMCNAAAEEEKKKAEQEEQKNAAAKVKADEEQKNAAEKKAKDEAAKAAAALENARNAGGKVAMPAIKSVQQLMADGQERYGVLPGVVTK